MQYKHTESKQESEDYRTLGPFNVFYSAQARIQDFLTGGVDCRGVPLFSLPFPPPPSLPLEVGPLKSS